MWCLPSRWSSSLSFLIMETRRGRVEDLFHQHSSSRGQPASMKRIGSSVCKRVPSGSLPVTLPHETQEMQTKALWLSRYGDGSKLEPWSTMKLDPPGRSTKMTWSWPTAIWLNPPLPSEQTSTRYNVSHASFPPGPATSKHGMRNTENRSPRRARSAMENTPSEVQVIPTTTYCRVWVWFIIGIMYTLLYMSDDQTQHWEC